jgi:hypothetical protein
MSDASFRIVLAFLLTGLTACTTAREPPGPPVASVASAQAVPQGQEERAAPAAKSSQPASAAAAAGRGAPNPKAPRRRSVQQVITTVPPPPIAGEPYRPSLSPRASAAPVPAPVSPPPAQINSCQGGQCTDAAGSSYNTGVGNSAINSQGRLCNRVGTTMQCF